MIACFFSNEISLIENFIQIVYGERSYYNSIGYTTVIVSLLLFLMLPFPMFRNVTTTLRKKSNKVQLKAV